MKEKVDQDSSSRLTYSDLKPRELFAAFFQAPSVGFGIWSKDFRYVAVNDSLALMHGISVSAHLGEKIQDIVGEAAFQIEPKLKRVFLTGQVVLNFAVEAELPNKAGLRQWDASYFPMKDRAGNVKFVGAIVSEITGRTQLSKSIQRLTRNLIEAESALRQEMIRGLEMRSADVFTESLKSLESSISEVRLLSHLLGGAMKDGSSSLRVGEQLPSTSRYRLSRREVEIVELLATGKRNREIAHLLAISTRTVEAHRAKIMLKLGLHSVGDLVCYAVRNRIVEA